MEIWRVRVRVGGVGGYHEQCLARRLFPARCDRGPTFLSAPAHTPSHRMEQPRSVPSYHLVNVQVAGLVEVHRVEGRLQHGPLRLGLQAALRAHAFEAGFAVALRRVGSAQPQLLLLLLPPRLRRCGLQAVVQQEADGAATLRSEFGLFSARTALIATAHTTPPPRSWGSTPFSGHVCCRPSDPPPARPSPARTSSLRAPSQRTGRRRVPVQLQPQGGACGLSPASRGCKPGAERAAQGGWSGRLGLGRAWRRR